MLLDDVEKAGRALSIIEMRIVAERDVLVLDLGARARELARVTRRLADAGVDVDLVYLATGRRLVLGVDDLERARSALEDAG